MGLFGRHDHGRDYHGEGRGFGDRPRGAWTRFEHGMEGGMPRGYDRGMRGGPGSGYDREIRGGGGYDASDFAYRGLDGAWSTARNRGAHDVQWDWRRAGGSRYEQDTSRRDYGRDYGAGHGGGGGYDRDFGAMRPTGGWYPASRGSYGRQDRYDVGYRGWNGGVGDEPGYQARDFRGLGRGRW
jgi:hypothetical protein